MYTVKKLKKGEGGSFKFGVFRGSEYIEGFYTEAAAEKAKDDAIAEAAGQHVTYQAQHTDRW